MEPSLYSIPLRERSTNKIGTTASFSRQCNASWCASVSRVRIHKQGPPRHKEYPFIQRSCKSFDQNRLNYSARLAQGGRSFAD